MKKTLFTLCTLAMAGASASADITVTFDFTPEQKEVIVASLPIEKLLTARRESDLTMTFDTIAIVDRKASLALNEGAARQYVINIEGHEQALSDFFAAPGENITVSISGPQEQMTANVSGTPLLDGISTLKQQALPLRDTILAIRKGENTTDKFEDIITKYYGLFEQYVRQNPDTEAAAYAMLSVDSSVFMELSALLGQRAKDSLYYPFVESTKTRLEKQLADEQRQAEMQTGDVEAPNFTLVDLEGKNVSLTDFRGKWVVLDFWGSWCGWCIKGFPKMKEAYAKHQGKVEFIGIDCGDSVEDWKAAVSKYQIPWVNVYNDSSIKEGRPDQTYAVQGYPTKIIINPEGKIAKIVTGEDPQFYTDLDNFLQ